MTPTNQTAPTKIFWTIAIIALLWNIMGLMQFVMTVFFTAEMMASLSEAERALYENTPGWINVVFAIAVITGTLGSVFLLMKKALAIPVFLISLVAVVLQMGHWIFMSEVVSVLGIGSVVMPILVILFALFIYGYARMVKTKGWLG